MNALIPSTPTEERLVRALIEAAAELHRLHPPHLSSSRILIGDGDGQPVAIAADGTCRIRWEEAAPVLGGMPAIAAWRSAEGRAWIDADTLAARWAPDGAIPGWPAEGTYTFYDDPFYDGIVARLATTEQVAAHLGKAPRTVRALAAAHGIGIQIADRRLFDEAAITQLRAIPGPGRPRKAAEAS